MNDLIRRQEAIDALAKFVPYAICDASTESYTNGLTDAYNLICQLPSAQPQIIRCKECRHSEYDAMYNDRYCHYNGKAEIVGDEHYCGYAERREE